VRRALNAADRQLELGNRDLDFRARPQLFVLCDQIVESLPRVNCHLTASDAAGHRQNDS
jgi:hypothetical protein